MGKGVVYSTLSFAIVAMMLIAPIHAFSSDRPSQDNETAQWLYSYEAPPIGNNPNGPVTDKSIPSPFSDSQISLGSEMVSYQHNSDGANCAVLCHDTYTFRLMSTATSRPAHAMPAPTYNGWSNDPNQCAQSSPSQGCIDTGINANNGGTWVNLPFTFVHYGQAYNSIFICSHGYVAFVYTPSASSCPTPPIPDGLNYKMFGAALDSSGNILGVPSSVMAPYMKPLNGGWQNAKIYYRNTVPLNAVLCPPSCGDPTAPAKIFGVSWYKLQEQGAYCNVHSCWDCYPCENTFSLIFDQFGNIWYWWDTNTFVPLAGGSTHGVIGVDDAAGAMSTLGDWNSAQNSLGLHMRDPNYPAPDPNHNYPPGNQNAWLNDMKLTFDDSNTADYLNPTGGAYYGHDIQTSPPTTKCDSNCQIGGLVVEGVIVGAICFATTPLGCIAAEAGDLAFKTLPFIASMPVATFGSQWMNCVGGGCSQQGYLELPTHQEDGLIGAATDSSVFLTSVAWVVPYDGASTHNLRIKFGAEMGQYSGGNTFSDTGNTRGWAEIDFTVDNGDFTLSTSPTSASLAQGSTTTFNVNLNMINYAQAGTTISLVANTPVCPNANGLCVSFSPSSVALSPGGSGSSVMTVNAGSGAPLGTTSVIITGTDPTKALTHSKTVSVTVAQPDFSISANPSAISAYNGSPGTSTINLGSLNTFSGTVSLSANAPSGFAATLNPTTVSLASEGTGASSLTVSVSGSPNAGSYTVTVTGSSGSLSHPVSISVSYPGDFSISLASSSYGIYPQAWWGSSGATVTAVNGFTGTISLTSSSSSGLSTTVSPTSLTLTSSTTSASSNINFYANSGGLYTFYNTGTSGSLTHSTATSTVIVYDFSISTNPTSFTALQGTATSVQLTVSSVQGYSGTAQLSITLPDSSWTTSSFPSSLSFTSGSPGSATFNISPGSATTPGTYTVTITGSSSLSPSYTWSHTTNLIITVTNNRLTNPGFETGDFTGWTNNGGACLRSDAPSVHSGSYAAFACYNSSTQVYSAFTLQQNITPVAGNQISTISLWYRYGTSADSVRVLYTDGTYTTTNFPGNGGSFALLNCAWDTTKTVSGIEVVRSSGQGTVINLDDFTIK